MAMVCFQIGAALAKGLFPLVGAAGGTALRLGLAAIVLAVVFRPWRLRLTKPQWQVIVLYGLAMGCMNFFFYQSLRSIPLGLTVALEFTGPLAVALAASRRPLDFVWILMAAIGLWALLPLRSSTAQLPLSGVLFGLAAGACWALYIVFGRKAGSAHGGQTTALGTLVAAVVLVPIGIAQNGMTLLTPSLLPTAFAVAMLSSAIPYSLEMYAMPRLPARTLGVLLSLDPALGALSGLVLLGETLSWTQWAAIAGIMAATAGSAVTGARADTPQLSAD